MKGSSKWGQEGVGLDPFRNYVQAFNIFAYIIPIQKYVEKNEGY